MKPQMKNFIRGVSQVIEIFPSVKTVEYSEIYKNRILNGPKNTSSAIRSDWRKVGGSFWEIMDKRIHERSQ